MDDKVKNSLMIATIVANFSVVAAVFFVWYVWAFLIGVAVFGVVFGAVYAAT